MGGMGGMMGGGMPGMGGMGGMPGMGGMGGMGGMPGGMDFVSSFFRFIYTRKFIFAVNLDRHTFWI